MNKTDVETIATDLNSVLRHATPETIRTRAETVWLTYNVMCMSLAAVPGFSPADFYARIFRGYEDASPLAGFPDPRKV
jgi:hypothetical protein